MAKSGFTLKKTRNEKQGTSGKPGANLKRKKGFEEFSSGDRDRYSVSLERGSRYY